MLKNLNDLDEIGTYLVQQGLFINNLFQIHSQETEIVLWRCSLRDSEYGYGFGDSESWLEAIRKAYANYQSGAGKEKIIESKTFSIEEAIDITLEDLGL